MIKTRRLVVLLLWAGRLLSATHSPAQTPAQTVSGLVLDKGTRQPLVGATIVVQDPD